jgi:hypothetical protein
MHKPPSMQLEYEFTLPRGYVEDGQVDAPHKKGFMRLATAGDVILPLKDPRVQNNPAYQDVILYARVVTKLGTLPEVNTRIIEGMFWQDFMYLGELCRRINGGEELSLKTRCPNCKEPVEVSISPGET